MMAQFYPGPTRRALLGTLGALGGSSLALRASRAAASQVDVVVVGAGAAGIGAAIHLKQMGLTCLVVEAAGRVGGRALTDTTTFRGAGGKAVPFDIGCARIPRSRGDDPFAAWSRKLNFETQMHDLGVNRLFYGRTPYSEAMVKLLGRYEEQLHHDMEKSPDGAASCPVTDWQRPMDATATY